MPATPRKILTPRRKVTTPHRPPRATPRRTPSKPSPQIRSPVRAKVSKNTPRTTSTPQQLAHVDSAENENGEEGITVAIRMRPLNSKETTSESASSALASRVWRVLPQYNSVTQTTNTGQPLPERVTGRTFFSFDRTFGEDANTKNVYDGVAKGIVKSVAQGLNGTIFAYGQTSSGKTYTMQGAGSIQEGKSNGGGGIVHMATTDIFNHIQQTQNRIFLVRTSFIEIYNEEVRDLLGGNSVLQVREDPRRGVFVNAHEEIVTDFESLLRVLFSGEKNRAVAATGMNERSSRSHTIFRITIESRQKNEDGSDAQADDGAVLISTLNLVDLAGSESVRHTGSTGDRQKEGGKINQSLLTLSRVIVGLGQPNQMHINFRDSKLTRILQPSLSGNARMAVICCATPSELYLEETRSTLLFASRAKLVKTKAQVNEVLDDRSMIKRLQRELAEARRQSSGTGQVEHMKALQTEAANAGNAAKNAEEKLKRLKASLLNNAAIFGTPSVQHAARASSSNKPTSKTGRKKRRLSDGHLRLDQGNMLTPLKETEESSIPQSLPRPTGKDDSTNYSLSPTLELGIVRSALESKVEHSKTLQEEVAELQQKLQASCETIQQLQESNKSLEADKEIASANISELQSDRDRLHDRVESLAAERLRGAFELARSNSKRESLEQEVSSKKNEIQQLSEDISLFKATMKDTVEEKEEILVRLSESQKRLGTMSDEKQKVEQQRDELQENLSSKVADFESLQTLNNELNSEVTALKKDHADSEAKLEDSLAQVEALTKESNERLEAIRRLEQTAVEFENTRRGELEIASSEKQVLEERVARLEEAGEKLTKEKSQAVEQVESLTLQVSELSEAMDDMQTKLTISEESLQSTTSEKASAEEALLEARETLDKTIHEKNGLQTEVAKCRDEYESSCQALRDTEAKLDESVSREGDLSDRFIVVQAEADSLRAETDQLRSQLKLQAESGEEVCASLKATKGTLQDAEQRVNELDSIVTKLEEENNSVRLEQQALLVDYNDMTERFLIMEASKIDLEAQLNCTSVEFEKQIELLRSEMDGIGEEKAKLLEESRTLSNEAEVAKTALEKSTEQIHALNKEKEALIARGEALKSRVSELEEERGDTDASVEATKNEITQLKELLANTQEKVDEAHEEARIAAEDLERTTGWLEESQERLAKREEELNAALETSAEQIRAIVDEKEGLVTSKQALESHVSQLEDERRDAAASLECLKSEVSELKELLAHSNEKVNEAFEENRVVVEELERKSVLLEESQDRLSKHEEELNAAALSEEHQNALFAAQEDKLQLEAKLQQAIEERLVSEEQLKSLMREEQRSLMQEADKAMFELKGEVDQLKELLSRSEAEAYAVKQELAEIQDQNKSLVDKALKVESLLESERILKGKVTAISQKYASSQSHLEKERKTWESQSQDNEWEQSRTTSELIRIKAESHALKHEIEDLRVEIGQLRHENEHSARESRALREKSRELEADVLTLEETNQDLRGRLEGLQHAAMAKEANHGDASKVHTLEMQLKELSAELTKKESRIKKLEATKLTKDKVNAIRKIKEERAQFEKDAEEYRARLAVAEKKISELTAKRLETSEESANSEETASLKFAKEALETKLRKYAAHCQRLESEKAIIADAVKSACGSRHFAGDIAGAVVSVCDKLSSLEEECDALSTAENRASSYLSEIDELRSENSLLRDGMSREEKKATQSARSEAELAEKLAAEKQKMEALRAERDQLKTIAQSERGNAAHLETEKSRQVRYLEQENLQLMLDLKTAKKQLHSAKAQLDAMKMSVADDDDTMDFGGVVAVAPSDDPAGVNDDFSTGWMQPKAAETPVDKENMAATNGFEDSSHDSTKKRRFGLPPRSSRKKTRNSATPSRALKLGEAGDASDDHTGECKQS